MTAGSTVGRAAGNAGFAGRPGQILDQVRFLAQGAEVVEGAIIHHGLHQEHAHAGGLAGPILGDMARIEGHAHFMNDDADAARKVFADDVEGLTFLSVIAVLHDVGDGLFHS